MTGVGSVSDAASWHAAPATDRPARGRRPTSERRRALQRLEISREAVRLFREQGVAATSGDQIAAAVGLSARTLWRWFGSKEACAEPLLSVTTDAFVATLRRWPPDLPLSEHLVRDHPKDRETSGDQRASLAVIAMSRHEPGLRAIWLVVYERAEPVLAEILAERFGRSPNELTIRVQAAALAAALRITSEDYAASLEDGTAPDDDPVHRLSEAVRVAAHDAFRDGDGAI